MFHSLSHIILFSLAFCHLTPLKINSFFLIHVNQRAIPYNVDHIALNFFKLLGNFLLNRHFSKLRALNGLPIIVNFLKLYKTW
jgi:hypothetical protein